MNEQYLDVNQLSAWLNIRRSTIYRWAGDGSIPALRFGTMWRFSKSEIDKWIKTSRALQKNNKDGKAVR